MAIQVEPFFHSASSTISYVVFDIASQEAALIDTPLDYQAHSGRLSSELADQQLQFMHRKQLKLRWILETHAHADHLSAASYVRHKTGASIAAGQGILWVQAHFKRFFALDDADFVADGHQFDRLLQDGDSLPLGEQQIKVWSTPGHTNDSLTYILPGHAFVGDTLFMPDAGTARCDFPGGDAKVLFQSITRLHQLPENTFLWMCHDYQPGGRDLAFNTTVAESRAWNIHVGNNRDENEFVTTREARDANLDVPRLLYPAVQFNIRAGQLPETAVNGQRFFKQPLRVSDKLEQQLCGL